MAVDRLGVDKNAKNRPKKLEKLGLTDISNGDLFDRLLDAALEYQELREQLESEVKAETRHLENKKDNYGLNAPNPLE